jgi:hypothetical protein
MASSWLHFDDPLLAHIFQRLSLRSSSTISLSSTFSSWVADMERADAWGSMWQPGKGMRIFLLQVLSTIPEKTKDVGWNK